MHKPRILAVDDDPSVLEALRVIFDDAYHVLTSSTGEGALKIVEQGGVRAVFLDITLPDLNGLEVLRRIRLLNSRLPVIMATATDSARLAVIALHQGAIDYLIKPFDAKEVIDTAARALSSAPGPSESRDAGSSSHVGFCNIIGESPHVRELCALIPRVAATGSTVLIAGESGTGKELVACAIHSCSARKDKPFVPINCASIPDNLLESELFGYEKGAFTGAVAQKIGMIELAQEGTLFLDEISDLRLDMQAKILRVLETRQIKRVGGTAFIPVDVRVICATNADLTQAVKEGRFREDLYYRLNVIPVWLKPLRYRTQDIPLLARHFLRLYAASFKKDVTDFEAGALELMVAYSWPGNVRELKNIVERLVALAQGSVLPARDLAAALESPCPGSDGVVSEPGFKDACKDFQRKYIEGVLERVGGNRMQAARILGIHRNALANKLKNLKKH